MNVLSNLNETYREYSLTPTDDLIRFWRSKVEVTTGHDKGLGHRSPSSSFVMNFSLLCFKFYSVLVLASENVFKILRCC